MSTVSIELSDDDLKEAVSEWLHKKTQQTDWKITLSTKYVGTDMCGQGDRQAPLIIATREPRKRPSLR
jgi:hypothetical protein